MHCFTFEKVQLIYIVQYSTFYTLSTHKQCIYNKETAAKLQASAILFKWNHSPPPTPQSILKEHCLAWGYLKSRSQHSAHRTDWVVLWKGLSCRIRRWELFSCWNWLAPALTCSTDMPCDWTPSNETPGAQILPVSTRG